MVKSLGDKKVSDAIVEHIMTRIVSGELKVGDRLPPQHTLAAELGVSRTALREAVRSLSLMGLLNVVQGEGTFVIQSVPGLFAQPLSFAFSASRTKILEVIEARLVIEAKTSEFCALRATEEELQCLRDIADDMISNMDSLKVFNKLDLEFHLQVARGCHNAVLVAVVESIQAPLLVQLARVQELPGAAQRAVDYHKRILEAIANCDSESASTTMIEHLEDVRRAVTLCCNES